MHKKTNLSVNIDNFFPGAKKNILPKNKKNKLFYQQLHDK
jgi:hypothetical protein